jgi:hypothetical protein
MSVSQNFPIIAPSLSLDFANVQALDPRITFARATTATYYGTRTALAEQNLATFSQEFDNGVWNKARTTVTVNALAAPDGTTTADAIYETAETNTHYVNRGYTPNGLSNTLSVFAKGGLGRDWVWFRTIVSGPTLAVAFFDVVNGVVGTVDAGLTATIQSVGNGWYRCVVTTANSSTTVDAWGFGPASANGTSSYAGDITKGVYLWGGQLEQRSAVTAYTPTTTEPITTYIPVLETAASGVARFDHNPVTFESLGLLIEQQSTNLVTYSEQFNNAVWTKTNATITANTIIAPDGTLTGDKLVETATTDLHGVAIVAATLGVTHTFSVYAKAAERTQVAIQTSNVTVAYFDLSTGVVISGAGSSIQSVGNGWYRCSVTATYGTSAASSIFTAASGSATTTGNGFNGIYIWGAQLEALAFPTSYIQTVASQVTRAADSASMTGTNFSSWYNQDQSTMYIEYLPRLASTGTAFSMDFSGTRSVLIYDAQASLNQFMFKGASSIDLGAAIAGNNAKVAMSVTTTTASGVLNSDTIRSFNTTMQAPNRLCIGAEYTTTNFLNSTIKKISCYPIAATSAQLQALTS